MQIASRIRAHGPRNLDSRSLLARFIAAAALICVPFTTATHAQQLEWAHTYGGSGQDGAGGMETTTDGGIIIAGFNSATPYGYTQVYLVKTDAAGNAIWSRSYGGPMNDYGQCVREVNDRSGGYVIAGRYETSPETFDALLIRTDAAGNLVWLRRYDLGSDERAHALCVTPDGGFLLAGQAWTLSSPFGSYDVLLLKTDANGILQWQRTYANWTEGNDVALSVEPTNDGGFIVGGFTQSNVWASYVIRIDSAGEPVWERTYFVNYPNECDSVRPLADGTFVIAGSEASSEGDLFLAKLAANGDLIWDRSFGGSDSEYGECVTPMPDGGFAVTGMTASFGVGMWDVYVVRTDPQGNLLWSQTFGGDSDDRGFTVRPKSNGAVLVAGWAWSFGEGLGDAYLLKINDGVSTDVAPTASSGEDRPLLALTLSPNPSRGPSTLDLELGRPGRAQITIIDASGRLVRALVEGSLPAGRHQFAWDGRDERGGRVASGVYFVRAGCGDRHETRRLTVLR